MRRHYKDLSLTQLRSFHEVYRLGGYAEAARLLNVSTSTVWEQMRGLERYFGAKLLESGPAGIRPNPEGQTLLELILPHLAGLESAREVLLQHSGRPPECVTIVTGMRMLLDEVATALGPFRRAYPTVRVRCLYAEDRAIEGMIEHGEADLGLMLEPGRSRPPRPTVSHEPAYELDFVLVTPPKHLLLTKRSLMLKDVVRYPLVLGTTATTSRRRIDEAVQRDGLANDLVIAAETNSAALTQAYVRAGIGIGITAGHRRGQLGQGLWLRPLREWFGVARYVFVRTRGAYLPPAVQDLVRLIREAVTDKPHGSDVSE
jgi:LysR family cys regulon transcriptional activator